MTEGNIATWSVKEGDSFAAGDVLLEIETDKATMDVEAQEDGILMKIMQGDGSKGVAVGTRIAVVAEQGDDISALEIPPDETKPAEKEASKSEVSTPAESKPDASKAAESKGQAHGKGIGKTHKHIYPLLPSVAQLVAEKGLDESAVSQITPTGPKGGLLKGDVLAYLGSIESSRPAALEDRFEKLSHLDLSNIKVAEKKAAPPPKKAEEASAPVVEDLEVAVPISFSKVIEVQKKIQDTLGVFLPLSTFISRATEAANDDLPASARPPTADELFDQVLGLDKLGPKESRGFYLPQVAALPPVSLLNKPSPPKKQDIIDMLAIPSKKAPRAATTLAPGLSSGTNIFSLIVPKAEEQRASVFLERVKMILEKEPGRLVL
jgi:hypothetical protein